MIIIIPSECYIIDEFLAVVGCKVLEERHQWDCCYQDSQEPSILCSTRTNWSKFHAFSSPHKTASIITLWCPQNVSFSFKMLSIGYCVLLTVYL